MIVAHILLAQSDNPFGSVPAPVGITSVTDNGLVNFGSAIIMLLVVIAGVYSLFNFVLAGIAMISSEGDPQKMEKARQKIFMSVLGLVVIAASFIMAALAGLILFGPDNFDAFINPSISGPDDISN